MLVLRKSDGKVISVSRQKVRVYESAYIGPLNKKMVANKLKQNSKPMNLMILTTMAQNLMEVLYSKKKMSSRLKF